MTSILSKEKSSASLARKTWGKSVIPANQLIIVPTKMIDKSNVDAFEAELKSRISGG